VIEAAIPYCCCSSCSSWFLERCNYGVVITALYMGRVAWEEVVEIACLIFVEPVLLDADYVGG